MPLVSGLTIHDSTKHKGSAARDTVGGVAAIGPTGNILAPGPFIELTRDGSDYISLIERTSSELFLDFLRLGANDYKSLMRVGGVWVEIQHSGLKGVADGLSGLDGSAKITSRLAYENVDNGVANLDATGNLLAKGSKVYLDRDMFDWIYISERDSDENVLRFKRLGVDDYEIKLNVEGSFVPLLDATLQDAANGIAGLDSDIKVTSAQLPLPMLTLAQFQANAATGTALYPEEVNNVATGGTARFDAVGEYAEIQLDLYTFITRYRIFGTNTNVEDGAYKIQHYEDGGWVDNTLNIPTNKMLWSAWAFLDIPVYTKVIRLVATSIDTGASISFIGELEVVG